MPEPGDGAAGRYRHRRDHRQAAASEAPEDSLTLAEALSRFEKVYLLNALKKNNWKRGPTEDSLGMDRRTLFRKMKDFGLEKE
ncbi:MAG: helix-turn-helix domain-containing protein [Bilophila wadsworthia]